MILSKDKALDDLQSLYYLLQCPKFKCVAKKYNLLRDGEMDSELFYTLLNNYVKKNPSFKSAIASAKKTCIGKQLTGMESCPPEKIFACVFTVMLFVSIQTLFTQGNTTHNETQARREGILRGQLINR